MRFELFQQANISEEYLQTIQDKEYMRFSEQRHKQHSIQSCQKYWLDRIKNQQPGYSIVVDQGLHIGNITYDVDRPNSVADISILIFRRYAGLGYGKTAFRQAIRELKNLRFRKITAGTMLPNRPMLSIIHDCEMIPDGFRISHYLLEGTPVDVLYYAIFN
jgi:[ribosomal protein S5]-alanine N-acetyltransferase